MLEYIDKRQRPRVHPASKFTLFANLHINPRNPLQMAPDWGSVQVAIALAILPLVIVDFWKAVGVGARWIWLRIWKKNGQCEYLAWEHVAQQPSHPIHTCTVLGSGIFQVCADQPHHTAGGSCWRRSFDKYFNTTKYRGIVKKPSHFPLRQSFLCVDKRCIEAFILLTLANADDSYFCVDHPMPRQEFNLLNLSITAEAHEESGEVLVHVRFKNSEFPNPHRNLTPHEIDCLLRGYPPYYRQYLDCYNYRIPSPIQSDADIYRGGWIIGVGLTSESLRRPLPVLPVYVNAVQAALYNGERTPPVFWRSLDRVLAIVKNNIKSLYEDERNVRNIQATIEALHYMIWTRTQSGVHAKLRNSDLWLLDKRDRELSAEECITAMAIFNESPHMDDQRLEKLKEELTPILLDVLKAALRGSISCVSYIKNGGRELNTMLPKALIEANRVFIRGCGEN